MKLLKTIVAKSSRRIGLGLSMAMLLGACAGGPGRPTVSIEQGSVLGVERDGAKQYLGIPYAAAPVGDLRWVMPQAPAHWSVRDAGQSGAACAQEARFGLTERSESEDCLTLNVGVPADIKPGEKLPVFFWIPGGGFVGGSANLYRLDKLAREGRMVVVTINYRLGVFGFMAHPAFDAASNGDLGIEDQRYALAWVQRNIAAFGGDPSNVTVAGESAGAGSVCMHLQSPQRVKGLFHKAVITSGGCLQPIPTVTYSLQGAPGSSPTWKKIATEVGCDTTDTAGSAASLACLRKASVADLLKAQGKAAGSDIMAFSPSIGNATVPQSAQQAANTGEIVRVPVLMGGATNELRLYVAYTMLYPPNITNFDVATLKAAWLPSYYPGMESKYDTIIQQYGAQSGFDGAKFGSMVSDSTPLVGINNCLYLKTADAIKPWMPALYQYEFSDPNAPVLGVGIAKGMDPKIDLGAVHSAVLNYLFPNLSNTKAIDAPDLAPASQTLSNQMVALWSSFVYTGAPAPAGLVGMPAWPTYAGGKTVMQLRPNAVELIDAAERHQCQFWKNL